MNRSKSAAVLMLVGAFAAGAGAPVLYNKIMDSRPRTPDCPQPRSDNSYRSGFRDLMARLGTPLDSAQGRAIDSLLDARNFAVNSVYAGPKAQSESLFAHARAKSDSILGPARAQAESLRKATREQQNAVLTPAQRAKLEERFEAMRVRDAERQAQRQAQQARCDALQPKPQSATQTSKQQPTKTKSNH